MTVQPLVTISNQAGTLAKGRLMHEIRNSSMSAPYEGNSGTQVVPGIKGTNSIGGDGVFGFANQTGRGVVGVSELHTGVEGNSTSGAGVWGLSQIAEGVHGLSHGNMAGVAGINDHAGPGVWGESQENEGVYGVSHSQTRAGILGANDRGGPAGFFQGNVVVTGNISASGTDLLGVIKQLGAQIQALEGQITQLAAQIAALH